MTAKNNSHYLLITLTFYQWWVAGVHVPQLEDSCQSAVRARRGVKRGLEEQTWRCSPAGKKGLLLAALLPSHPLPTPTSGLTGRGLTEARHNLLSFPVHRRQAKITADTCQAIQPQGQRLTSSNKLLRTMDLRHMQTCD